MSFRFDPDGDPTQTTPAQFVMSVKDLSLAVERIGARLDNGQAAFEDIRKEIHGLKNGEQVTAGKLAELVHQSKLRDEKLAENTEITADIRILLEGWREAINSIDAATKPFRWLAAKTFLGLKWIGEQLKWIVPIVIAVSAAYAWLRGRL